MGTTLGVGLLTALAGANEVKIVEQGRYALLRIGPITSEVVIALIGNGRVTRAEYQGYFYAVNI